MKKLRFFRINVRLAEQNGQGFPNTPSNLTKAIAMGLIDMIAPIFFAAVMAVYLVRFFPPEMYGEMEAGMKAGMGLLFGCYMIVRILISVLMGLIDIEE